MTKQEIIEMIHRAGFDPSNATPSTTAWRRLVRKRMRYLPIKSVAMWAMMLVACCSTSCSQRPVDSPQSEASSNKDFSLRLERTACLGNCPVYSVEVDSKGRVVFVGAQDTKIHGKAEANLSAEETSALMTEIKNARFFELKDSYDRSTENCPLIATDHPTVQLFVRLGGREKTIKHDLGCSYPMQLATPMRVFPAELFVLENRIDEILKTERWVGRKP